MHPSRLLSKNLGDFSEELSERFHKVIEAIKKRNKDRLDSEIVGDYIWSFVRQDKRDYKRKTQSTKRFRMTLTILKNLC